MQAWLCPKLSDRLRGVMAWHFSISLKEKCQYRIKWYTHFLKQKKCMLVQPDRRIYCMRSKFSASGLGTFTVMQSVIVIGHHFVPPTETFQWNSMKNCMSAILITFYVVCVCSFCVNGWQVLVVKVCPGIWVNHVKCMCAGEDPETRRMRTVKNIADLRQNLEETMSSLRGTQISHR